MFSSSDESDASTDVSSAFLAIKDPTRWWVFIEHPEKLATGSSKICVDAVSAVVKINPKVMTPANLFIRKPLDKNSVLGSLIYSDWCAYNFLNRE